MTLNSHQLLPLQVKIRVIGKLTSLAFTFFLQFWTPASRSQCHQYRKKKRASFCYFQLEVQKATATSRLWSWAKAKANLLCSPGLFSFGLTDTNALLCAFPLLSVPPFHPPVPLPRPWLGVWNLIIPVGEGVYELLLHRSPRQCWTKGSGQAEPRWFGPKC